MTNEGKLFLPYHNPPTHPESIIHISKEEKEIGNREYNKKIGETKWAIKYKEGVVFANLTKFNGCEHRKCPCRWWVNCAQYVDMAEQQRRLKIKSFKKDISDWYDSFFRIKYEYGDSFGNG